MDERRALCQLWDLDKGSLVHRLKGHTSDLRGVAISPDGRLGLSAGGSDGTACLWDLQTGRELRRFEGHGQWAHGVAFSPDGSCALTGGQTVMFLWDVKTGQKLRTFQGDFAFVGVAFTPDGRNAVSGNWWGGRENSLRLWELPYSLWTKPAMAEHLHELSKSVESNPGNAALLEQRGCLYAHLGQYDEAAGDFIRANELLNTAGGWDYASGLFDSLMQHEEVFAAIAARRPGDLDLWGQRGAYFAARSQWQQASAAFARASEGAGFGWKDPYARALVLAGDEDGYRRLCVGMAEQFGKGNNAPIELVWVCTMSPRSGIEPTRILEWARQAVNSDRNWLTLEALTCASYRAGQFHDAVTLAQERFALRTHPAGKNTVAFPLALAYRGLGQHDESREWYQIGLRELKSATPRDPDGPAPWAPAHWMFVNIWYREAKAVFEPQEKSDEKGNQKDTKDTKKP
jgi:tetratricopeptide (TPR) repeat protein